MEARFRSDYAGEFVVINSTWGGGKKTEQREWIPNPIENQHISGRAACIGSDVNFGSEYGQFDYTRLQRHRGGLLSSKKLQTYGVGSVAQRMRLDFAVESDKNKLPALIDSGYATDNIVYTTGINCVKFPGNFYLIPYNQRLLDIATIIYLAAFDGHKDIFLLGYTDETDVDNPNWIGQVASVFTAYPGVQFHIIGESTRMPDLWLNCGNVRTMDYREWISYCDV
jgi:hypothetical protein